MRLRVAHLPRVHRMDYLTLHDHAGEMQTHTGRCKGTISKNVFTIQERIHVQTTLDR